MGQGPGGSGLLVRRIARADVAAQARGFVRTLRGVAPGDTSSSGVAFLHIPKGRRARTPASRETTPRRSGMAGDSGWARRSRAWSLRPLLRSSGRILGIGKPPLTDECGARGTKGRTGATTRSSDTSGGFSVPPEERSTARVRGPSTARGTLGPEVARSRWGEEGHPLPFPIYFELRRRQASGALACDPVPSHGPAPSRTRPRTSRATYDADLPGDAVRNAARSSHRCRGTP